jgi:hypothetical protein
MKKQKQPNKSIKEIENVKYFINNTEIPVVITNDSKIYFDINETDNKILKDATRGIIKNKKKLEECQRKIAKSMEYLYLEGFLLDSISEN